MICDWQPVGAGFVCRHCGWQAEAPLDKECQPLAGIPVTLPPAQPLPAKKAACCHRGARLREEACPSCKAGTRVKVLACSIHGECTVAKPLVGRACCRSCPDYEPAPLERPPFVTTEQLVRDTYQLASQLPPDLAGIIGVARSGLLPASLIAMHLHLPLWVLRQSQEDIVSAGCGTRLQKAAAGGPLLLVDDTTMTGRSLSLARQVVGAAGLADRVRYAAIYRNPDCRLGPGIEFFAQDLAHPHLLEWNLFNSTFLPQMAFDFDGILCEDWTARPKYLARKATIRLIVTGRLEQDREVSLAWLASHGIQVQELVMWPGSLAERDRPQAISRYKAEHFRASGLGYFVESCPVQAQEIAQFSGKPVICPAAGKVF